MLESDSQSGYGATSSGSNLRSFASSEYTAKDSLISLFKNHSSCAVLLKEVGHTVKAKRTWTANLNAECVIGSK
jgi:hypothetical protein